MRNRAVVDTNILVSALLRPGGPPDAVIQAIRRDLLQPVVCDQIVAEYRDVLARRRFRLHPADTAELVTLIEAQAAWAHVTPYPALEALPDPADWPFIAAALAAACPVITGNARHFPKGLGGLRVMTAREWMEAV